MQMPSRKTEIAIVILRSVCAGVAAVVAAFFLWVFGLLVFGVYLVEKTPHPVGGEVGIDVVTLAHNSSISATVVLVLGFAIGFALGIRYFSRPLRHSGGTLGSNVR
jgi:hypothetical protein